MYGTGKAGSDPATPGAGGHVQRQALAALWRLGESDVGQVRQSIGDHLAYNSVQAALNQLVNRGLAARRRQGRAMRYSALVDETDYVSAIVDAELKMTTDQVARTVLEDLLKNLPSA